MTVGKTSDGQVHYVEKPREPSPAAGATVVDSDLDADDECSNLTDDRSLAQRVSNRVTSVLGNAGKILTGELPDNIPEENDGDEDIYHSIRESRSPLGLLDDDLQQKLDRHSQSSSKGELIDFLKDNPSTMTLSRRLALQWAQKPWYNPRLNNPIVEEEEAAEDQSSASSKNVVTAEAYPFSHSRRENPSIEKAWAYFDHVSLPRYIVKPKPAAPKKNILQRIIRKLFHKANKQMDRAEPGEKYMPTALYHPLFTPHKQLGDWGLGFGLYFSTLRALAILTFVAGMLNIPNFMYFAGDEYNTDGSNSIISDRILKGSAICTAQQWVLCPDCQDKLDMIEAHRIGGGVNVETGDEAFFILRNLCDGATIEQGFVHYVSLIFIAVGVILLSRYLHSMEVTFDEDEQTAQDYSVLISNPPGDATDPEEWRKYFYDRFDGSVVTALTIAVDNDFLVRSLVERRETLRKIEMMVEPGTSMDALTLAGIAANQERERKLLGRILAMVSPGIPELFARLVVLTAKVQGLSQQDYPVTNIFVTFETEAAQRYVLYCLSVGSLKAYNNRKGALKDPKFLFRDEFVLAASEPDEPNTIRWQDLNEKFKDCFKQQAFTTFCTFCAVALIAFIVSVVDTSTPGRTAVAIAIFNSIFPMFAKMLTDTEAHASEGGKQRSLYFKIALFRWVNTAIVITLITPFTDTLENDTLIKQVSALFVAEIVTTNVIQLVDPVGHLQRHFLAPRASTQDAMNLAMQGQQVELAERYTNMTKILFLALWYCAIFPGAYFMCSVALFINYFTDRFSLMRTWKRAPNLGPETSAFSRRYFFSLAVVAMAVISSYYWASFPFDNVCRADGTVDASLAGTWDVMARDKVIGEELVRGTSDSNVVVNAGEPLFQHCQQNFFEYNWNERKFPYIPKFQREGMEWMTESQETVANVFGWTSVAIIGLVILKFLHGWFESFMSLFRGNYDPRGDDQNINYSDVPSMSAYVPQVESKVFSYPLLACNFDGIDEDLLDWADPDRPLKFYDLTKDAEVLLRGTDVSAKVVFSQISHWPPYLPN